MSYARFDNLQLYEIIRGDVLALYTVYRLFARWLRWWKKKRESASILGMRVGIMYLTIIKETSWKKMHIILPQQLRGRFYRDTRSRRHERYWIFASLSRKKEILDSIDLDFEIMG